VLGITPNCDSALRQLRHEQEVRKFWVDSICIDQTSHEERNLPVALMGEIYKRAEQVVV
jgi:Heterokaryon incompatibility protein (HET)